MPTTLRHMRFALVLVATTTSFTAATAQGFFESLFGAPPEGRSAYTRDSGFWGPASSEGWNRPSVLDPADKGLRREVRKRVAKKPKPEAERVIVQEKQTPVAETADAPRGSLAYFAKDKTLRSGDVIVTDKGFMIFQGGDHHTAKSFVALSKAGPGRNNLVALEQASIVREANVEVEIIKPRRDFIGPRTSEQLAEIEPKAVATAQ